MKKTDAELIWEALLQNAKQSLLDEGHGLINRANLDTLETNRDRYEVELTDEEKAVIDHMIAYLTKQLPPEEPYKKANKISAMWSYIKRRMQRG